MKKLTAGIFATILGLTAIDAYAAIPTQNYVDEAMGAAVTSAKSYTDSEIGNIGDMTVKAYVDAAKNAASYDDTALAGRVKTLEDAGYITNAALTDYATKTYAETEADAAQAAAIAAAATDATTKANAAEAAAIATAKGYADETFMTKTAHESFATKIGVIEVEQVAQNEAIAKKQNAFTGTCPAGATCYVDATGAIQVAVDKYTPAGSAE